MNIRPRWSLYFQVTVLVLLITLVAVVFVSQKALKGGQATLLDHEKVDLRDETRLRAGELREQFVQLARAMREATSRSTDAASPTIAGVLTGFGVPPHAEGALKQFLARPEPQAALDKAFRRLIPIRDIGSDSAAVTLDGQSIGAILLFGGDARRAPELVGGSVVTNGEPGPFGPIAPDGFPGLRVVAALVERVLQQEQSHPLCESAGPVLEQSGNQKVCRLYLARKIYHRPANGPLDLNAPHGVLVVAVNLTRYFDEVAVRSPRHVNFLFDSGGTILYHPDSTKVGTRAQDSGGPFAGLAWGTGATLAGQLPTKQSGEDGIEMPDIASYHTKKLIPVDVSPARKIELTKAMGTFAAVPWAEGGPGEGLRYNEINVATNRIELSHPSQDGLDRTKRKIDDLIRAADWPPLEMDWEDTILDYFGAPGGAWFNDLYCNQMVIQFTGIDMGFGRPLVERTDGLPHPISVGGYVPPKDGVLRFAAASSVQEMIEDAAVVTEPSARLSAVVICSAAVLLSLMLTRYVTKPLTRIADAAGALATNARRVADSGQDPLKSAEHFVITNLPDNGPAEIVAVSDAFREMITQLSRMTSSLQRRTAEMDAIMRTASDGIVLFAAGGDIESANSGAERMFGYPSGGMIGLNIRVLSKGIGDYLEGTMASSTRGGEFRAVRSNGQEFWAEAALTPVRLGDRVLLTAIVRDITDRKKAEDDIRRANEDLDRRVREKTAHLTEAQHRLEHTLEQALAAAKAKDTFVANMNHELRQPLNTVIGYTEALREEAVDGGYEAIVPDLNKVLTSAKHLLNIINDILDMAAMGAGTLQLVNRDFPVDSMLRELRTLSDPLAWKNKNVLVMPESIGTLKMNGDIKRVTQVLLNLVSNACKFTANGRVEMAVVPESDAAGKWIKFVISDTGKGMTDEQCRRLGERFYQADDTTKRQHEGTGLGLAITRDLCRQMGGTLGVSSQLGVGSQFTIRLPATPPDKTPFEIRREDQPTPRTLPPVAPPPPERVGTIDAVLSGVIHDFGNRVGAIKGYVEDLQDQLTGGDLPAEYLSRELRKILGFVNLLMEMRKDLLDLEGIETHVRPPTLAPLELLSEMRTLVEQQSVLAFRRGNTVNIEADPDLGTIVTDARRLRRILFNLLDNACTHAAGTAITLRLRRDGDRVVLSVADNGPGMTAEKINGLFKRHRPRGGSAGYGLGLIIAKTFAESLGGTIDVTSKPGEGATFTLTLPTQIAPVELLAKSGQGRRILVIDDDTNARELMRRFLEKDGFVVMLAASGEEGMTIAKQQRPDLITLDVMMPGVDGWATLAALKTDSVTAGIPVVMVTMVDDRGRAFALGATDYLTKPIDWHKLSAVLTTYVPEIGGAPVLVIDDNEDQRDLLTRLLNKSGRSVVTAANGKEGLARLDELRPSLILLDMMMPVMDGFEFLAALHQRDAANLPPVIVLTAMDLTAADIQRLNGGVTDVIRKGTPMALDTLLNRLKATPEEA